MTIASSKRQLGHEKSANKSRRGEIGEDGHIEPRLMSEILAENRVVNRMVNQKSGKLHFFKKWLTTFRKRGVIKKTTKHNTP